MTSTAPRRHGLSPTEHAAKIRKLHEIGRACYSKGCYTPASIELTVYRIDAHGNRTTPDTIMRTCGKGHHRLRLLDNPSTYVVVKNVSLPPMGRRGTERQHAQIADRRQAACTLTFKAPDSD
jgi:hypothetical protein